MSITLFNNTVLPIRYNNYFKYKNGEKNLQFCFINNGLHIKKRLDLKITRYDIVNCLNYFLNFK